MATGGRSSKLGASSSRGRTKTAKQQEEKRKQQCATRAEQAKKPRRPSQLINVAAAHRHGGGSGTAAVPVVVPPLLHCAASSSNMATPLAFPFPMAGVNGAAPLWSTAAMLGAASRAAAAAFTVVSSPPATAGAADGPAAAPFVLAPAPPGLPLPDAPAAAAAGAEGQLVPVPLHFAGYCGHTAGGVVSGLPAPAVGIPLAAALDKMENGALARMLSALMPVCHPPLRLHQRKKAGGGGGAAAPPPPWWPTGSEHWWAPDLLAHLDAVAALVMRHHAPAPPVPFAPGYSLKKAQKVALLVAIVKHLAPDFARIAAAVRLAGRLSVSDTDLWHSALNNERAKYMRPVFVLLPPQAQPEQQGGGGGGAGGGIAGTPSAAGSVVVVHSGSGSTDSDGCEKVAIAANLPAGSCASVSSAPAAADVVSRSEAITAAELVEKEPQRRNIDGGDGGGGVVPAASDALAGDGGDQRPLNFPPAGDGDGSTHNKQGAAVAAAAPTGHIDRQVVAGGAPEMTTTMQPEPDEQHGGVPGNGDVAAAAEDDQVQAHPLVDMEEEGHQWWYNSDELNRMFAEFESFGDDFWY